MHLASLRRRLLKISSLERRDRGLGLVERQTGFCGHLAHFRTLQQRQYGVPVRLLGFGFLLVLGLSVAETSQITGALLVFALLVTPAATAHQLTPRPLLGIALSVALALAVTWLGLALAYFSIYPVGFYVTSLSFGIYVLVRVGRALGSRRATARLAVEAA